MASTMSQMKDQKNMAKKQADLQKEQARLQEAAAAKARDLDMATLAAKETETKASGEAEKFDRVRQAAQESAAIRLASAEAGVFGNSIFRQIAASQLQGQHDVGIIEGNTKSAVEQIGRERQGVDATFEGRTNDAEMLKKQAKFTKKSAPGGLSAGLNILGAGVGGFSSGYSMGSSLKTTSTK